ncbi:unnamed protein product [Urochloa humidicola]
MDLFGAPATNPGFTPADSSPGGRGVPPRRGSGGVEELDLDLHLGLPYGERLSSASVGVVGEAAFAGSRRGAAPSRAASTAREAMATRSGWRGAPGGAVARPYRAPRPANAAPTAARGPPVGGRGGVGGSAGVAAGGQYADDAGALGQESQGHAEWRKLKNGPPECLDNLEVMFEHTAADALSCVLGQHNSNEGDDGGDESEDWGEESDVDGDYETADFSSSDGEIEKILNRRKNNRQFLTMAVGMGGTSYRWVTYSSAMKKRPRSLFGD